MATAMSSAVASSQSAGPLTAQNGRLGVITSTQCCFWTGGLRRNWQKSGRTTSAGVSTGVLRQKKGIVVCGLSDYIGGDLLGFDLGRWSRDVEQHGAIAIYPPAEGGYEGRYATKLKVEGYHFLDLTARGLGDLEAYLTKIHGVRPVRLSLVHSAVFSSQAVRRPTP